MIVLPPRLLAGLACMLALALLLEWIVPASDGQGAPLATFRTVPVAPKVTLQARAVGEWADVVLARPLFSISRRPPRVEASSGAASGPEEARLSGILIGRFGRRAIFAPQGGGKPLVLAEGAAVNDSTIRKIAPDAVYLASGAVLTPSFDKNRVPTAYTPPFQPIAPNFPQPGFPAPGFPAPGFPGPNFPAPRLLPQPAQDGEAGQTPPNEGQPGPMPMFRGGINPQRRE